MAKNKKIKGLHKTKKVSVVKVLHIRFVSIGFALLIIFALANIPTTHTFTVGYQAAVLGDDEEKEEEHKEEKKEPENREEEKEQEKNRNEEQKKSEEQQNEEQKRQIQQQKEAIKKSSNNLGTSNGVIQKTKTETFTPDGLKMKTEQEGNKRETEIETADGQKIKTKVEDDGTTNVEVENGTVKLKYKVENGKVVVKAENEDGQEVELEENELDHLEESVKDDLENEGIQVAETTDNKVVFTQKQVAAVTDFPLSVDPITKQLLVTTPAGQKVVTILPDQAIQNLLATGMVSKIETQNADITTQQQLGAFTGVVKLEAKDDKLIYKVNGSKTYKMLGFIPMTLPIRVSVSTETGNPIDKEQSVFANIVDFLSP